MTCGAKDIKDLRSLIEKQIYLYSLNDAGTPGFEVINPISIKDENYLIFADTSTYLKNEELFASNNCSWYSKRAAVTNRGAKKQTLGTNLIWKKCQQDLLGHTREG